MKNDVALGLILTVLIPACADDPAGGGGTEGGTGSSSDGGVTVTPPTTTMTSSPTTDPTNPTTDPTDPTDPSTSGPEPTTSGPDPDSSTSAPADSSSTAADASTGSESGSDGSTGTTGGMGVTVYDVQDGTVPAGTEVELPGLVVSGVAGFGFFAQDPAGGEYSGVFVYTDDPPTVAVGDEVDLAGIVAEVNELTEIDVTAGAVTPTGVTGVALVPDEPGLDLLAAATGEPWESVYVRIEGTPLTIEDLPGFQEWIVGDGADSVWVDNFLYDALGDGASFPGIGLGANFTAIQGPLNFTFGNYKIAVREAADLVGYQPPVLPGIGVDDLIPGDLIVTEVMYDPTCANDTCEWIEVYNDTPDDVNLAGLRIQDSNLATEGTVAASVIVPAFSYAWIGAGAAAAWPYTDPADAHWGNGPGFNNSGAGDLVAILNGTEILDQTGTYTPTGAADDGRSWKLKPAQLDAVANDDPDNWCFSTAVFDSPGGTDEYGSPGAANEVACQGDPTTCDEAHGYTGCCVGNTVWWFENGVLNSDDCGPADCGWNAALSIYDCAATGTDPSGTYPLTCGLPNPTPAACG